MNANGCSKECTGGSRAVWILQYMWPSLDIFVGLSLDAVHFVGTASVFGQKRVPTK